MRQNDLYHGDCLEVMATLPDGCVDMVCVDPPYGTTACAWDSVIPFEPMWAQLHRLCKPRAAMVFTASQPFTSALVMSNIRRFKYCWVWRKNRGSNFATTKYQPMKEHEDVVVFCDGATVYNPIMMARSEGGASRAKYAFSAGMTDRATTGIKQDLFRNGLASDRCPSSIIEFNTEVGLHPTQKPIALMEYLIRTYTNEGMTVLDFTMGSGTTGVAARNLNRGFIGIEQDPDYYRIACERIGTKLEVDPVVTQTGQVDLFGRRH